MHVLVCDDDPSTRFVMRRLLTQNFGCTITECGDGVEVLKQLDEHEVDLIVLDIEMPHLDGLEVLEAIRSSSQLKSVSVVMMSRERREDIILKLVRLRIDAYILKPLRNEKVLAALEPLRAKLADRRGRARPAQSQGACLGPDSPALLVDGNLDYRHFFISQVQGHGPIIEAASGAAAIGAFRQTPVRLVFIGSQLGVLQAEMLITKLRAFAGPQPLRIVGIVESGHSTDLSHIGYDDTIVRSYVPDKFKAEFRRFTKTAGLLASVATMIGDPAQLVASATQQVFGMMLDSEVEPSQDGLEDGTFVAATSEIQIAGRFSAPLTVFADSAAMTAVAARMLGAEVDAVTDDDRLATVAELANLMSGRLHAVLDERGIVSDCGLPKTSTDLTAAALREVDGRGLLLHFAVVALGIRIHVALDVRDLAGAPASPAREGFSSTAAVTTL